MMRNRVFHVLAGAIFLSLLAAGAITSATEKATDDPAILKADEAFRTAVEKNDSKAAGALLYQEFTWTNETGRTLKRAEFLKDAAVPGPFGATKYTDLKERQYGELAIVTGTGTRGENRKAFFARIWVKRSAGWVLLLHQDTRILASSPAGQQAPAPSSPAPDSGDCDNPCKHVPYTPKTADQGEVVKAYQAVETAVTSHDPKTWADHVADEFVGIGRKYYGAPDTKAGRVGQIGIVSNRVILPKMLWLQVYVFGDAGIMIADHQPAGERPYHVIRVWVNRDGRWQLFHRQETTIEQTAAAN